MMTASLKRVKAVLKAASQGETQGRRDLLRLWRLSDVMGLERVSLTPKGIRKPGRGTPPTGEETR